MVPGFGGLAECQSIGTSGKKQRAFYLAPKIFIFPTGPTALDSEPRGRRYFKNMIYNRNRLYSRAIHCLASMEIHYVQWFLLKSVQDIMVCEKIRFSLRESGWTKAWCPGLVCRRSATAQEPLARSRGQWQDVEGLLFSPKNSQFVHILSFRSQGVLSLFIFPTSSTALDSAQTREGKI